MNFRLLAVLWVVGLGLTAGACRPPVATTEGAVQAEAQPSSEKVDRHSVLRAVPATELPALLDDGDRASLRDAVALSRSWYARKPPSTAYVFGPRETTASELVSALDRFLGWLDAGLSNEQLAAEVLYAFEILESVDSMLVTGYYEAMIDGSLRPSAKYPVPIYGPPGGMIRVDLGQFADRLVGTRIAGVLRGGRLVPFADRQELRQQPLRGREIAWARDPVDLFFLEVQGSGALLLPDGRELRIGYAGSNGRPYRSIGRLLIDEGKVPREQMSMQAIRAYLDAHPEEVDRVLDHNPSVVFFRQLNGPPLGSLGLPVTAERSVATDLRLFPRGALGFLVSEVPRLAADGTTVAEGSLTRFVLNHDTGGAIRGAGRVDFFWGRGEQAAARAGAMKQPGRLFFLVPRQSLAEPG